MGKFIPNAEQLAKANKMAAKHKVDKIYMNRAGEMFLQEDLVKLSVPSKDDYATITITPDGTAETDMIRHVITEQDLEDNPFMRLHYKVGDVLEMPRPVTNVAQPPAEEEEGNPGDAGIETMPPTGEPGAETTLPPVEQPGEQDPPPPAPLPFDVNNLSEKEIEPLLKEVKDLDMANRLLAEEEAGMKRKGVVKDIKARIQELGK